MRRLMNILLVASIPMTILSCGGEKEKIDDEGVETALVAEPNEVNVSVLTKRDFNHELISNGKVAASRMADLRFEAAAPVQKIYVKNGDRVRRGDKIAELDRFKLRNRLKQSKDEHERAYLDLQDVLIGQGFAPDDTLHIPKKVLSLAKTKSGYERTKIQYDLAKYEYEQAELIAPFDGVVANLFVKEMNQPKAGDPFCRIIGSDGLEVEFQVLESELPLLRKGNIVEIAPYAIREKSVEGRVSEINPLVDATGMVKVKASVSAGAGLFEGMNVKVKVQRALGEALVVPKEAVVLRTGRKVMFKLINAKAYWVYVETGMENSDSFTIMENKDLGQGDTIIVSGNINLAHESPVIVKEIL